MARSNLLNFAPKSETYLAAGVIGIGLAVVGLYAFLSFSNYQSMVDGELENHTAILERASVEMEGFIDTRFLLLGELASNITIDFSNPKAREEKSSLFLHRYPEFQKIRIVNADGKDLTAASRLVTLGSQDLGSALGRTPFEKARVGRSHIDIVRVSFGAIPSTELAIPIRDARGKVQGVIIADLDLRKIWDTASQIKVGTRGAVYIVDSEGSLAAHPDRQFALTVPNLKNRSLVEQILSENIRNPLKPSSGEYINELGINVFAVARALPFGWGVVVEEPKEDFFRASSSILRLNIIVTSATLLLIFFLTLSIRSFLKLFQELKKERSQKAEIIANLSDGLIVTDGAGKVIVINARARELLSIPVDVISLTIRQSAKGGRLPGVLSDAFFPPDAPEGIFKNIKARRELKITALVELFLEIDTVVLAQGKEDSDSLILFVLRDVTRDRILSRLKSEFISIAAHQLRTPLSAIKWALRLVLDGDLGPLSAEQKEYIKSGYDTNERMIRLVNDLLNVSRIEEGRFDFAPKEDDLTSLVEATVTSFKDIAIQKKIDLSFKKSDKLPPVFKFDRIKMQMVLQNLVENAIDYTPAGGRVEIGVSGDDSDARITVRDSGIGMAEEDRKFLFTKFHRAAQATKMQPNGSGLGLFIAQNIVHRHGGRIEVESEVGKGSTFRLILPTKKMSAKEGVGFEEFFTGLNPPKSSNQ